MSKLQRVFEAWNKGMHLGFANLRATDHPKTGPQILSFRTPILMRVNNNVILNVNKIRGKHSRAHARRQHALIKLLSGSGIAFRNAISGF